MVRKHLIINLASRAVIFILVWSHQPTGIANHPTKIVCQKFATKEQKDNNAPRNYVSKSITNEPKNAGAYIKRSREYCQAKKFQQALKDSYKAIALAPRLAMSYDNRAFIYINMKRWREALTDANKALTLAPRISTSHIYRGYSLYCLGQFQRAIEAYTSAIKITPGSSDGYLFRADAYGKLGQIQKRIDDLTAASQINPKNAELYERRAFAYYRLGNLQNAITDCDFAIKLNPASSNAYYTKVLTYEDLGLFEKAVKVRTKLLENNPQNAFDWSNRANDYEFLGNFDQAQADRRKAMTQANPSERLTMQLYAPLINFTDLSANRPKAKIDKQLEINPIILPFSSNNKGLIFVTAQVNGHSLRLMLDTGCGHSSLFKEVITPNTKLIRLAARKTKINAKQNCRGFLRARSVRFSTLTLLNVAFAIENPHVKHPTFDGYLGSNILENFVVTIDYSKKQVILATRIRQEKSKTAIIVPIITRDQRPCCRVKLNGKLDVAAILDTGCSCSVSAESLLKPILEDKLSYQDGLITGQWITELRTAKIPLKSLEMASSNFEPPLLHVFSSTEAPEMAGELLLGNDFLSRFRTVTFDYPARRVIFEPK